MSKTQRKYLVLAATLEAVARTAEDAIRQSTGLQPTGNIYALMGVAECVKEQAQQVRQQAEPLSEAEIVAEWNKYNATNATGISLSEFRTIARAVLAAKGSKA